MWTEDRLQSYIENQIEENLQLEYKGAEALAKSDGKKKEISKDVSSLANSDGGILIYGIKEFDDRLKKHLPERIDPIDRLVYSKEWLEHVINSNISPRIYGIEISSVKLSSSVNHVAYILEIPKSNTAHQAKDFRYYRRYNFESIPMYDYEVRDLMNRSTTPILDTDFLIEVIRYENINPYMPKLPHFGPGSPPEPEILQRYRLKTSAVNNGSIYANYVNAFFLIPYEILDSEESSYREVEIIEGEKFITFSSDNTIKDLLDTKVSGIGPPQYKYGPSRYDPVLPGLRCNLKYISLNQLCLSSNKSIQWEIYADNAKPKQGEIKINDIPILEKEE